MLSRLTLGVALLAAPAAAFGESPTAIAIPHERTVLPNGLVVILSEDHTLPMVTVNLMVKVGSRFEPTARTGFAHLFEHLMFMGTARADNGAFDTLMEREGGWNNAWTSTDRTDYFDVAPAHVLPLLLWLEADRFSNLGTAMTSEKLDLQRKVVRNERRQQTEEKPYGSAELLLPSLLFPGGHPYFHPVIGSHEDLEAAGLEDVRKFFDTYYVPNNVSLVVSGDFDPIETRRSIETLFGGWARGATPPSPSGALRPKLSRVVEKTVHEEHIELAKVIVAFHAPARFAKGDAELDVLAKLLGEGKSSRLYKRLVFERELAQSVRVYQESRDLSSVFRIECVLRPKVSRGDLLRELDAALVALRKDGVTDSELKRAKNDFETEFVEALESVTTRASLLNTYETYRGDPGYIDDDLERYRAVTVGDVNQAIRDVVDLNGRVILTIEPTSKANVEQQGAK